MNGRIVTPGLIDANLSLNLDSAHYLDKRRKAGEFYDESLALMRSCLQHGTLAADIKASADAEHFHADISVLRKLASIGNNPVRMVRTWRIAGRSRLRPPEPDDFHETLNVLIRRKLIHFIEMTGEPETPLDGPRLAAAREARIGIKLLWPGGTAEALANLLDRLHPRSVSCLPHLSAAESISLAKTPSIAVFATGKDLFEGPTASSARQIADAGGAIALSSGYESTSAASFSMQMSLALAVVRLGLTAEEAFSAATINAAHAAGCAHLTGSLELGKQADLLILNVGDYREVPRQFGINHVDMAIRQGIIVLNRTRWKAAAN